MASLNAMRGILVAGAVVATLVAAASGMWAVVAILGVGLVGHALLWVHLHRAPADAPAHD
jgi:hypothetical protein